MKIFKIKFIKFIPVLASVLIFTQLFLMPSSEKNFVRAEEYVNAEDEISESEKELEEIKRQQQEIKDQISNESQNQEKLQGDAEYIESVIRENELKVRDLELELQKLELETTVLSERKVEIEEQLADIKSNIDSLNVELEEKTNLLYKMSFNTPSILDDKSTFQDTVISREKIKAVVRLVKSDIEQVELLEKEAAQKNEELAEKQTELINIQSEKVAQSANLTSQQSGLEWQKQNKEQLSKESVDKQQTLLQKEEELAQKRAELEIKIASLRDSLNTVVVAPNDGVRVAAGEAVGVQGRTGLSCNPLQEGVVKTNTYCEDYGYTSPDYYYYDPIQYPTSGSHLHFMYFENGVKIYPGDLLTSSSTFESMPMANFNVSRGYHEGGAIDLVSNHGAPVLAVKPGVVRYYCINYPAVPEFTDPAYGAVVYHDDGSVSQYWHLQRNGAPCVYLY